MKLTIKSEDTTVPEKTLTPGDGEKIAVSPGEVISFPDDAPVAAVPQGEDLALFFEDGSSVILEGFFAFGPEDTPPRIDLGEGKTFSASQTEFQAADGLVVAVFEKGVTGGITGYEPAGLGDLSGLGLGEIVQAEIMEFVQEHGESDDVDDLGSLPPADPCTVSTFSGTGLISGTGCPDILIATVEENNTLEGFAGDDSLSVHGDADVQFNEFFGGAGTDSLSAESTSNDVEYNLMDGGTGVAGDGNDTIVARTLGYDVDVQENTLLGGAGDDSLRVDSSDDSDDNSLLGGDGVDRVIAIAIEDTENNTLDGGAGDDLVYAAADVTVYDNSLVGGDGSDTVFASGLGDTFGNSLEGNEASDRVYARSHLGDLRGNSMDGGEDGDVVRAFAYDGDVIANSLKGGDDAGADLLRIEAGRNATEGAFILDNTLDAGAGSDRIDIDLGPDQLVQHVLDHNIIDGGADAGDTLRLLGPGSITRPGGVTNVEVLDVANGDENHVDLHPDEVFTMGGGDTLRVVGDSGVDVICIDEADWREVAGAPPGFTFYEDIATGTRFLEVQSDLVNLRPVGINTLVSGVGDDSLTLDGTLGDDTLAVTGGMPGSNTLNGAGGDDSLFVQADLQATDNLLRGDHDELLCAGDDTLVVESAGVAERNTLEGDGGSDSLFVRATGGDVENNRLVGGAGPGNAILALIATAYSGDITDNIMIGGDGEDSLLAQTEAPFGYVQGNTLEGGAGGDVLEARTQGSEAQILDNSLVGGDGADSLLLSSTDDADLNVLDGGAGADSLFIQAGDDAGSNSLVGGSGVYDDTLVITATEDVTSNTLEGGEGNDSLFVESVEQDVVNSSILGGAGDDTLVVNVIADDAIGNTLDGGEGTDDLSIAVAEDVSLNSLFGGTGNGDDIITADAGEIAIANSLAGGAGADSLEVVSGTDARGNNLSGGDALPGDTTTLQNDTLSVFAGTDAIFNVMDGGDGDDILSVGAYDNASLNSLFGAEGNDTISVSGGDTLNANTLIGGEGDDSLGVLGDNDEVFSNFLLGDAGADTLVINVRNDVLSNGMDGGDGSDSLRIFSEFSVYDNRLVGGDDDGDDTLSFYSDSIALRNSLLGGDGNDLLEFEINTVYQSIQETLDGNTLDGGAHPVGGPGDTLLIRADGDIDSPGLATGIEVLDVTNGDLNRIDLDTLEVQALNGGGDSLRIHGDGPGDSVVVDPAQWSGPTAENGFNVFQDVGGSGLFMLVQNDLTIVVPGAPVPPEGGDGDEGGLDEGFAAVAGALLASAPSGELDFEGLDSSGSLAGGDAGAGELLPVGADEVLDVAGGVYSAAIAAVDDGAGTGQAFAPAGAARGTALQEIAVPPVMGDSPALDMDAPADDGLGIV